jgi:Tol biopolymer transport system component
MKRFVLLAAGLLVWQLLAAASSSATFPASNGRIVFLRGAEQPQIYSMAPDGTNVRQLTSFKHAIAFDPAWSPDGRTIAFTKAPFGDQPSSIWTMNARGGDKARLHGDRWFAYQNPSYSPDGVSVVFSRCYPNFSRCDLQTMNADGTGVSTLTSFGMEVYDLNARYSPGGSQIAFGGFGRGGVQGAVYVIDADGSDIRRVTGPHLGAFGPDWSPDGSTIAMATHCCDGREAEVASIGPYGGHLTTLTHPGESLDFSPSWAPQGDAIIFERDAPDFSRFDTWIMAPDGSGATLLKRNAFEAVWGPAR